MLSDYLIVIVLILFTRVRMTEGIVLSWYRKVNRGWKASLFAFCQLVEQICSATVCVFIAVIKGSGQL